MLASSMTRPFPLFLLVMSALLAVGTVGTSTHSADAQSQSLSKPANIIMGRVVTSNGMPIHRARLEVGSDGQLPQSQASVFTDRDGRFEVRVPEAMPWRLRISKPGFAAQTLAAPEVLKAIDRDAAAPMQILLGRGAVLTGEVVDQFGDPVMGAVIRARFFSGKSAGDAGGAPEFTTDTDDRGAFRIGSLPAGEIEVTVSAPLGGGPYLYRVMSFSALPIRAMVRASETVDVTLPVSVSWGSVVSRSAAASPASWRAGIRGRVLGPNDRPVPQAVVEALPLGGGRVVSVSTNELGQFQIAGLPAGRFRVRVAKNGFPIAEYGQSRAVQQGKVLSLGDGQQLQNVDIALTRGAVVTGRLVDGGGEPLEGVLVQPWLSLFDGTGVVITDSETRSRRTDDRGEYRLDGLLPATYYIVAGAERSTNARKGLPVYYPGRAALLEAEAIRLDEGQELSGLVMTFDPPLGARVSGRAVDSTGRPLVGTARLNTSLRSGAPKVRRDAPIRDDGSFEFADVAPGEYVVQVGGLYGESGSTREFGTEFVRVDPGSADPPPLTVMALPGSRVSGRIVLEGGNAGMSPGDFVFWLYPSDPDVSPTSGLAALMSQVNPDWTFSIERATGTLRFLPQRVPDGWWLKSVIIDGTNIAHDEMVFGTRDSSRQDVEVVFARQGASVTGRALDRRQAVADYSVIVFPTDVSRRYNHSPYMKLVRSDQEGRFTVNGLPPGEYWVGAIGVTDGSAVGGNWMSPDALNALVAQSARRLRLNQGQSVSLELELLSTGN